MAFGVIGREEELGGIRAFLVAVEQGPAALVLSGEPGMGKTVLWQAGVDEAERRFGRVLWQRSVEAEAGLGFAGLSDLVNPVLEEVAASLAPPRRRALEVALLLAEPGEQPPDPRAIGLALLDVLGALAERGPLVVALDDVQWLDSSSAGVLQIALRRLRGERIGLFATSLKVPAVPASLELERAFPEQRLERLWVGPLSLGALHHLLKERLELELTRPELARVLETSGGNPFFALELGRELVRTDTRPLAGRALRVPESLHELLGGRLARLPAETADALLYAAALARPTIELVSTAKGEHVERVREALAAAVAEAVVELDDAGLRFAHPLLASICYEQASAPKRRAVHLALAEAVSDIEERARHHALAADGPDAAVASELDIAADKAAARGATAAAAELCELAAGVTEADPALARARKLRAAKFHRLAGNGERAAAMLEQLLTQVPSGVERADVLLELLRTLRSGAATQMELCDEALAEAAEDDARCAQILGFRMGANLWSADARAAAADARLGLERAERAGDPALVAEAIARLVSAQTYTAEVSPGLLERGIEIEEQLALTLEYAHSPRYALARLLARLGEVDRARAILEEQEARALEDGDEGTRVMVSWPLSMVEWLAGRWQQALERALVAHELTELTQYPHARGWVGRARALVEADLGLVDEARASAEEGLAFSRATSNAFFTIVTLGVLGRLELALGNLEAAGAYLRELPAQLLAGGTNDPTLPVWADAIETLIALGELEQARAYLEPYEGNAERLGSAWALAVAARCRGLLSAAEGDSVQAFEAFERALAELQGHPFPLERGRTLLCLGSVYRKAKQKRAGRDTLGQALALFEELGAPLWAEKARAELRRISGRRRAADDLTETEARVAELAAEGRSNKEIAAALFMSVHTVGAHLSRVYRKLGVRSRSELAGRLAKQASEAAKPASETAKV